MVGIVTDRDLVRRGLARGLAFDAWIDDVMSAPVVTIERTRTRSGIRPFRTHGIRRLAVVQEERFVGMITIDDLLINLAGQFNDLVRPVTAEPSSPISTVPFPHPDDGRAQRRSGHHGVGHCPDRARELWWASMARSPRSRPSTSGGRAVVGRPTPHRHGLALPDLAGLTLVTTVGLEDDVKAIVQEAWIVVDRHTPGSLCTSPFRPTRPWPPWSTPAQVPTCGPDQRVGGPARPCSIGSVSQHRGDPCALSGPGPPPARTPRCRSTSGRSLWASTVPSRPSPRSRAIDEAQRHEVALRLLCVWTASQVFATRSEVRQAAESVLDRSLAGCAGPARQDSWWRVRRSRATPPPS